VKEELHVISTTAPDGSEWSAHALAATFLGNGPFIPVRLRFGLRADLYPVENRRIVVSLPGVIAC